MHGLTADSLAQPVRRSRDYISKDIENVVNLSSTEEDKALTKMRTLRNLLQKYLNRIETLKDVSRKLKEECRRLKLIAKNIDDDRAYKLDLNKLSAFGFEDM